MGAIRRGRELSPGMRREIIGMHEGGMSFADIGRELHMSENTTRKNLDTSKNQPFRSISTTQRQTPQTY